MIHNRSDPMVRRRLGGILTSLVPVIGLAVIFAISTPAIAGNVAALVSADADEYRDALRGFKLIAGNKVVAVYEMDGDVDRGRKMLAEIERKVKPDLIFAVGTLALQVIAGQSELPVVYAMVLNPPTTAGASARNVVGGASMNVPVDQSLRVLKELGSQVKRVGIVYNPARTRYLVKQAEAVAREDGLRLMTKEVAASKDVVAALDSLADIDAFWIVPDETILPQAVVQQILLVAARRKIPVLGVSERHASMGAAASLSFASSEDIGRQAGEIAQAVLADKAPAQIPYTTARRTTLVINLKVAQKLGLEIPQALLARATNVIR